MIGNLKALGLALVAMLALGAVAASAASAQQGEVTSDGPVTLDTSETGGLGSNALTAFGSAVECPGSVTTGHKVITHAETTENVTHELLPEAFTTVTITPHWNKPCHVTGSRQATVTMNGCDFVFHVGSTKTTGQYNVIADVVCPAGQKIVVHIYANTPPSPHGTNLCTVNISAQAGLEGATIKETPEGHLGVAGTFEGIHTTREGLCLFDGKGSTEANAKFDIDVTVEGTDKDGKDTPLSLSEVGE